MTKDVAEDKGMVSCLVCGRPSQLLYSDAHDYTFGVQGEWGYMVCMDNSCGTIQIDPMPVSDVINTFYKNYR